MQIKSSIYFLTLLLICICNQSVAQKSVNWENEFQQYIDLIPQLVLPVSISCDYDLLPIAPVVKNSLIEKYMPEGATIIGKIYQDNNEVAIVYGYATDIFYPIISIYNRNAKELREVRIFELDQCAEDAGYSATFSGTITNDYKIKTHTEFTTWNYEIEKSEKKVEMIDTIINLKTSL